MNGCHFLKARLNEMERFGDLRADRRTAGAGIDKRSNLNRRIILVLRLELILDDARVSDGNPRIDRS